MNRALVAALGLLGAAGCTDPAKVSEEKAVTHAAETAALVDKDVEELRRGLPAGARKLSEMLATDKEVTPARARTLLRKTREAVVDLQLAKSTFFVFTDPQGMAHASDLESDGFSGKNVLQAYPGLAAARDKGYAEVLGQMDEARGLRAGDDLQWVAAAAVPGEGGKPTGLYVSGWSLRRFAYHLEEQLKSNLRNAKGTDKPPLIYVFVLHGAKAYGAPVAPDVNVKAVEGLGLPGKLSGGTFRGRLEITNRSFGAAAQAVPKLCEQCTVVVLRSEV